MKSKLFSLVVTLSLLITGTASAQIYLDANLTDLRYDATEDAIVFNLEIKAGEGYVSGTVNGSVKAMNLRYDIFLEPGVTIDVPSATVTIAPRSTRPGILSDIGCSWMPSLPVYSGLTADAINFSIQCRGEIDPEPGFDFNTKTYSPVATVKIPVTSSQKPGAETYLKQRPTIDRGEASVDFPYTQRNFWGTSNAPQITNGYFEKKSDFHLRDLLRNGNATATDQITSNTSLQVYPNPTGGMIYIETGNAVPVEAGHAPSLQLRTPQGQLLLETTGNELDLSAFDTGVYLLQVNGDTVKVVRK